MPIILALSVMLVPLHTTLQCAVIHCVSVNVNFSSYSGSPKFCTKQAVG